MYNHVALIFIFNHYYPENIAKINNIYKKRFSAENIYYLVPFYKGEIRNVIPVFESSYSFQGYFSQAFKYLLYKFVCRYDYYIFIADDLILNSHLDSSNIIGNLSLNQDSGYIKQLIPLSDMTFQWQHSLPSIRLFLNDNPYLKYSEHLPDAKTALSLFANHDLKVSTLGIKNLTGYKGNIFYSSFFKNIKFLFKILIKQKSNRLPYPLAMGYADFFVIPQSAIEKFCYFCGVFAAMNLFAEVAIPTAMIFSCSEIVTEKNIEWQGLELWDNKEILKIEIKNEFSLNKLQDFFSKKTLYIHPIKLSKWN